MGTTMGQQCQILTSYIFSNDSFDSVNLKIFKLLITNWSKQNPKLTRLQERMKTFVYNFVILFHHSNIQDVFVVFPEYVFYVNILCGQKNWVNLSKVKERYIGQNVDNDYCVRVLSLFEVDFNAEVILNLYKL